MTTTPSMSASIDLEAYLSRIGFSGQLSPTRAVLEALHLAHATHIPFENLDILLGRPIRLDLDSLQAKLVGARRGGYCFEQNLLFAAALEKAGFSVQRLAARVRYRTSRVLPRTHMMLLVAVEGAFWLADVGFGAEGLLLPVPFGTGEAVRHFAWTYRVSEDGGRWVLQSLRDGAWQDLYAFTLEPQELVDFELANYYTSTHPDSRFVQTMTVQLPSPEVRVTLRDRELVEDRGASVTSLVLPGDDEILRVLANRFDLHFPPETRFFARSAAS